MGDNNVLNLSDVDKGYIAGILDGEGSLVVYMNTQRNGSFRVNTQIRVGMTDKDVIYWLKDVTGLGNISKGKQRNPKWKPAYIWEVAGGNQVAQLLLSVGDYLKVKKQHANIILELCYILNQNKGRFKERFEPIRQMEIYWEMKELNKKGLDL